METNGVLIKHIVHQLFFSYLSVDPLLSIQVDWNGWKNSPLFNNSQTPGRSKVINKHTSRPGYDKKRGESMELLRGLGMCWPLRVQKLRTDVHSFIFDFNPFPLLPDTISATDLALKEDQFGEEKNPVVLTDRGYHRANKGYTVQHTIFWIEFWLNNVKKWWNSTIDCSASRHVFIVPNWAYLFL